MTRAARSVNLFGWYLLVMGTALLVSPNTLLGLFALGATTEVWIRVVGMLVVILGVYYRAAAAAELTPFFLVTVLARASVPVFFIVFVLAGWAEWPLVLFGIVDGAGALWTWRALQPGSGTA